MAYNGFFPANYQPMVYQPQMQQPQMIQQQQSSGVSQPIPQQNNPMIWVQGETGAKSYLLAPNTTLPLWDSENQIVYLKSTDASGMPSMKILDYTIRDTSNNQTQNQAPLEIKQELNFVTHEELEKFKAEMLKEIKYESTTNNANGKSIKK